MGCSRAARSGLARTRCRAIGVGGCNEPPGRIAHDETSAKRRSTLGGISETAIVVGPKELFVKSHLEPVQALWTQRVLNSIRSHQITVARTRQRRGIDSRSSRRQCQGAG